MKKLLCLVLVQLVLLSCMAACNFTQNISGTFAGEAESAPKVEEMLMALAENRGSDAKALLHPQAAEESDAAIAQMRDYLTGRKVGAMKLMNINVNTSTGTAGNARQEQVAYQVTLTDGAVIYVNTVYLSDDAGVGFASFQLVLGVV